MRTRQAVSTLALSRKPRYTMQGFGENRQMGGWLDDLWDKAVSEGEKALDKAIDQGTNQVVTQLYKIVGLDGKEKTVAANSPEYQAYLNNNPAVNPVPVGPSIFEQYQKEILIGAAAIGGLLVVSIVWKMFRPAPAPMIVRANPHDKGKKKSKKKSRK